MSAEPGGDRAPIIVSALFGDEDFAWLDGLRRAHFPPARNHIPAHLTLFHHLPPSIAPELGRRLDLLTRGRPAPRAYASGLIGLGQGVAIRIDAPELAAMRAELAEAFTGLLTPQDAAGWRAHVTIQNKVSAQIARALRLELERGFVARTVRIAGLAAWHYRGGPWEALSRHRFG